MSRVHNWSISEVKLFGSLLWIIQTMSNTEHEWNRIHLDLVELNWNQEQGRNGEKLRDEKKMENN